MYKLKLCLRYLRTRMLLAFTVLCIMLGVGVMIVVNGVMAGFSHEMRDRMHGVLSDVTLESWSASGFPDAQLHMERIRKVCGDKIASMTPLCQSQGLVSFQIGQDWIHQPVYIIGIDPDGENESKDFGKYFQHPLNREKFSFELREDGYEQSSDPNHPREQLKDAGWKYRRNLIVQPEIIREPITDPAAELKRINAQQEQAPPSVPQNTEPVSSGMSPQTNPQPETSNNLQTETSNISQPETADSLPSLPPPIEEQTEQKSDVPPPIPEIPSTPPSQGADASGMPNSITPKQQTPSLSEESQDDEPKAFPSPHNSDEPQAVRNISGKSAVKVQANYPPATETSADNPADGTVVLPELPSDPHAENEALERESAQQTPLPMASQPSGFVSNIENDPITAPQKDESGSAINDPFNQFRKPENVHVFDPRKEQHTGMIMGISLASIRTSDGKEKFYCWPGRDVKLTMASASMPPKGITDNFTVVDIYESKMSEFDSQFVFIPLDAMQRLRAMFDPISNKGMVNAIRIKLKDEKDGPMVRDLLKEEFNSPDRELYKIQTWQDQRSNLLSAVEMERSIMNVLLFLIIAVCGFSIMTIFLMIVSEKVKDIGILRALGASALGIMSVFLIYGLLLGIVGSVFGVIGGLIFLDNINPIADCLSSLTGRQVFPPDIYYFYKIPTCVEWQTIVWIVIGTITVTVLASVFPAWRAASMQPVETLRS
ncbi:MAG: FtsX-like permease family protein [Thermoguttaceae bacterium]|nr:FtsX-like permease family protein [Thermoguttaceae bacterium]